MKKVLINKCYGGLNFSEDFIMTLLKKYPPHTELGKKLFCPEDDKLIIEDGKKFVTFIHTKYSVVREEELCESYNILYYDLNERLSNPRNKLEKVVVEHIPTSNLYSTHFHYVEGELGWRDMPEVISLVEEYGIDKAGGKHTRLSIEKVPDDYEYTVVDHDRLESIAIYPPEDKIIQDLLNIINKKEGVALHPLTKKLLAGKTLIDIKKEGYER